MTKKQRPRLFERLKQGLEEGIAHARGEIQLVTRKVSSSLPPPPRAYRPADVVALRERLHIGPDGVRPDFLRISQDHPELGTGGSFSVSCSVSTSSGPGGP